MRMRHVQVVSRDFRELVAKLGLFLGLKWLVMIALNVPTILRSGNLLAADQAMGPGPFRVRYSPKVSFTIQGVHGFSGIREMYARDTYLHKGILAISDGDVVVDLGSAMGNFANLALAHGPSVRVVAVEPSRESNENWYRSVGGNAGFLERSTLLNNFVGQMGDKQKSLQEIDIYQQAGWMSEEELIATCALDRIDFLKCDIEGGEYDLLHPGSKLLAMTRNLAIEIHKFAGDPDGFLDMLRSQGFGVRYIQRDPDGTLTALASRGG
jgi:FkbM family methyltransferase